MKKLVQLSERFDKEWDREKDPQGHQMMKELNAMQDKGELTLSDILEICIMIRKNDKGQSVYYMRELAQRWHFAILQGIKKDAGTGTMDREAIRDSFRDYEALCDKLMEGHGTDEEIKQYETLPPTEGWKKYLKAKDPDKCQVCGSENVEFKTGTEIYEYRGSKIPIEDFSKWACSNCGEEIATTESRDRSIPILLEAKRAIDQAWEDKELRGV